MKGVQTKHLATETVVAAVRAYRRDPLHTPTPDVALAGRYPVKVVLAKMAKLVDAGVLDYGVSLRTAWVVGDLP